MLTVNIETCLWSHEESKNDNVWRGQQRYLCESGGTLTPLEKLKIQVLKNIGVGQHCGKTG